MRYNSLNAGKKPVHFSEGDYESSPLFSLAKLKENESPPKKAKLFSYMNGRDGPDEPQLNVKKPSLLQRILKPISKPKHDVNSQLLDLIYNLSQVMSDFIT